MGVQLAHRKKQNRLEKRKRKMEKIKSAIRTQTTDMILECVTKIGGGQVSTEQAMVRAALIDIYIEREGEAAGETLMDLLGM
jgi:hypothetical protein